VLNRFDILEGWLPVDDGAGLSPPRPNDGVLFAPKLSAGVAFDDG
jgi:hypothetical protein